MRQERGLIARLSSFVRGLLLAALVCAAGLVVGRQFLVEQVDEQIRAHVERLFSAHYAPRGLEVRVDAARRLEGKGIEIRGFAIRVRGAPAGTPACLSVDELLLACRTDLTDLVLATPEVTCLTLRRLRVRATCDRTGCWNVERLLPLPDLDGTVPRMLVEDATIELQDLGRRSGGGWAFREINVQFDKVPSPGGPPQWRFVGTLLGDHFKRVKFQGITDPAGQVWSAGGTIDGLEMSQQMLSALPADLAGYTGFLTALRARAHFDFQVGHGPQSAAPIDFTLRGHIAEGRVEDPRLPLALSNLEADVWCDNRQLRIERVTAQSGTAELDLSCRWDEFLGPAPRLQLAARVRGLQVDERLYPLLPDRLQAEWDKFTPRGTVDVTAQIVVADEAVAPEIDIQCHDVSFCYHGFPLRLQQGRGDIHVSEGRVTIPAFTALAGGQTVRLAAELRDPGPHVTGWFTAESAGPIPLNEELISALHPTAQKILHSLHPTGAITVTQGRVERLRPDAPPVSQWEIELHDCTIQYDRFPYPIDRITGKLTLAGKRWMLRDARGHHGSGYLTCTGDWVPVPDGRPEGTLQLQFECWDLPLDEPLQAALGAHHPGMAQLWDSLRPRGTVDHVSLVVRHTTETQATTVDLEADKWPPSQNVPGRTITCHPVWLPLRLEDVVGKFTFRDGRFELHNVSAVRGASRVELAGAGQVAPDDRWEVVLHRVIADRLVVDRELVEALPEALRPALRQLQYRGVVSLNGSSWFRGGPSTPLTSGWDLLLDLENGALESELQVEHIHGAVRLTGQKAADGSFSSGGELEIDSLMTRGTQCTQLHGPLWFNQQQLLLGSRAAPAQPGVEPRSVTARTVGGQVTLDAQLLLTPELPFSADIALADASVVDLARLLHTEVPDIRGRVFALVHLQGARAGLHTLQGHGQVQLREADIYELPVMARLLRVLSLRQPDDAAFTSSDIDFRINGEQVYFDRIDFSGDLLRLKGQGWMDLGRQLNLDFYALVGRGELQLPILKTIVAQASRSILQIQVLGTVDQPQVIRKPLPELDETLQRMFPEAIPRTATPRTPWTRAQ